jgi:hypothetical protein
MGNFLSTCENFYPLQAQMMLDLQHEEDCPRAPKGLRFSKIIQGRTSEDLEILKYDWRYELVSEEFKL